MLVPLAWLREYVELPADPQTVADRLAQLGFPVDALERRPSISGVIAGKIVALAKHPNADRLQVGTVDVAGERPLTIATAATNVAAGQIVPIATIGARLPHLTIEPRKMRGIESEGMMCSAEELALPADWFEDGIMQLDPSCPLGADVVEYFRLSDAVLDVDVTSNRVDAMSMIGLARELAASLRVPLRLPSFENPGTLDDGPQAPQVAIESPDCNRFVAQRFEGVRVGTAPAYMRIRLALAGQRPINNLVDISNYVMLETGQPLHFYDDAKIRDHRLVVRDARPGERLVTLDDQEHELTPQALVIADLDRVRGLAGLKGGKDGEVTQSTTAVLLESANFNGARIRRTSARLGFRTEAGARHEKTLAPALTDAGAARAAQLLVAHAGAIAYAPHAFGAPVEPAPAIRFATRDVRRLLGYELSAQELREHLERLGFRAEPAGEQALLVTPPAWRRDVSLPADLVEEIARMAGYERLEAAIPAIPAHDIPSHDFRLERTLARTLVALGYREIISYSLHGAQTLEKIRRAGFEPSARTLEVRNPLSEDQRYLRYALGPGLLEYFARVNAPLRVFEIGHVFSMETGPSETQTLAFGFMAEPLDEPAWRDTYFLRLKGDCETLVRTITGRRDAEVTPDERNGLHPGKTAVLLLDGREIANVGRVDPRLLRSFDVRLPVYLCSMYLENIPEYRTPRYVAPSRFPSTYRDLALVCDPDVPAVQVERTIASAVGALCTSARAFDEYRGRNVAPDKKSLAVRVVLQRSDATITDEQADAAIESALRALRDELGVTLRQS